DDAGQIPTRPHQNARARYSVYPARGPRTKLRHQCHAFDWFLARRSVFGNGGRGGGIVRTAARRRERRSLENAHANRQREKRARLHRKGEKGRRTFDGLWTPRLQKLRPARQNHQAHRRPSLPSHGCQSIARNRARTRTHCVTGRILYLAQALPERRFLLRLDLSSDGFPGYLLPRTVRHSAHRRLAGTMGGNARRPRTKNRAPASNLYRRRATRLCADVCARQRTKSKIIFFCNNAGCPIPHLFFLFRQNDLTPPFGARHSLDSSEETD